MASTESKKYILPDEAKTLLNEGLEPLKKTYDVFINLKKTGLRKVHSFIINNGEDNVFGIQVILTTFLSSDELLQIKSEFAIIQPETDETCPYKLAVLEYVSKYVPRLYKKYDNINFSRGCNVCGKKTQYCKKCACRSIYYCSTDCQKADWKRHKTECKRLTA
jgi:hypothetical protein